MSYAPLKTVTVSAGTGGFMECSGCPGVVLYALQAAAHRAWHNEVGMDPADQVSDLKAFASARGQVTVLWVNPVPAPSALTVGRNGTDTSGNGAWSGHLNGPVNNWIFDKLKDATTYTFTVTPQGGVAQSVKATTQAAPVTPSSNANGFASAQPAGLTAKLKLALADDFLGTSLDTTKWLPHRPDGSGDGEKGWGSEWFHSDQVTVLQLPTGETVCRLTMVNDSSGPGHQRSGCISTGQGRYEVTPGSYVEARIRVPDAASMWPAFWLFGPGWPPEYDIFEFGTPPFNGSPAMGDTGKRPVSTWHPQPSGGSVGGQQYGPSGLMGAFHTYGCLWGADATSYTMYVDGVVQRIHQGCNPPAQRMHLVLSHQAQYQGDIAAPVYYDIDWVRIWTFA